MYVVACQTNSTADVGVAITPNRSLSKLIYIASYYYYTVWHQRMPKASWKQLIEEHEQSYQPSMEIVHFSHSCLYM